MENVTIGVEISRQSILHCVCAGFEGGIGYWAKIMDYVNPPKDADLFAGLEEDKVYRYLHYPLCEAGGGVVLGDAENGGEKFDLGVNSAGVEFKGFALLNYAALLKGVRLMAEKHPRHFASLLQDDTDAETGDVLIQLAVFGYLVFG